MASHSSTDDIEILKGFDAIRRRSRLYISNTGLWGLHCPIDIVLDRAVEEAIAGDFTQIHPITLTVSPII